jgi:hypothetical protein
VADIWSECPALSKYCFKKRPSGWGSLVNESLNLYRSLADEDMCERLLEAEREEKKNVKQALRRR